MKTKLALTLGALVATALPLTASTLLTGRAHFDWNAMDGTLTGEGGVGTVTNSSTEWYSSVNYNNSLTGLLGGVNTAFATAAVTLETGITSTTSTITSAYRFTGTGGDNVEKSMWDISGDGDLTWEFWLNPAGTGDNIQVIYEDGGSGKGVATWYDKTAGTVNFGISNAGTATATIATGDFSHVVASYNSTTSLMSLYVNNVAGTSATGAAWNGGDYGGLAQVGNSTVSQILGNTGEYEGDIAVIRVYDEALSSADIATTYGQYAIPEPSSALLVGLGGLVLLRRRRN